jgi:hypothetical protein
MKGILQSFYENKLSIFVSTIIVPLSLYLNFLNIRYNFLEELALVFGKENAELFTIIFIFVCSILASIISLKNSFKDHFEHEFVKNHRQKNYEINFLNLELKKAEKNYEKSTLKGG